MTETDAKTDDAWRAKVNRWVIGAVVVLFAGIAFAGCVASNMREDTADNSEAESITQCEARIEKLLKAPATADFDSTTSAVGSSEWRVKGTVYAENSFGAKVRADYGCTVVMNSNNTATTTVDYFDQ